MTESFRTDMMRSMDINQINFIFVAYFLGAYLLGSIPFGLLLTKWFGMGDIRDIGSGNIGTTNVLRTGSKKIAGLTFLCDALKGTVPAYLASIFEPTIAPWIAFTAVFGHIFPVWLKFKGGKGVATSFGATLGLSWPLALMMLVTWVAIATTTRLSSLAALVTAVLSPVFAFVLTTFHLVLYALGLSLLLVFTHKDNIKRLILGQESKIGDTSESEINPSTED